MGVGVNAEGCVSDIPTRFIRDSGFVIVALSLRVYYIGGSTVDGIFLFKHICGYLWDVASSMFAGQKADPHILNPAEGAECRRTFSPSTGWYSDNHQAPGNKLLNPNLALGPPLWPDTPQSPTSPDKPYQAQCFCCVCFLCPFPVTPRKNPVLPVKSSETSASCLLTSSF